MQCSRSVQVHFWFRQWLCGLWLSATSSLRKIYSKCLPHTFFVNILDLRLSHQFTSAVLFSPATCDETRGPFGVSLQCFGHRFISGGTLIVELAHAAVIRLDTHTLHAFDIGRRGALIDDELAGPLDIGRASFVKEIDVEPGDDIGEKTVDILESLVVRLERVDELRGALHDLLGQNGAADVLQEGAPFGHVGAVMRSTHKEDSVCRHEDGAQMFDLLIDHAATVDQGALDYKAPEGMADEDDGTFGAFSQLKNGSVLAITI